ncbi:MFS transporter [Brasilonema sp. CT11]|nr:MFS transporter [Brasilonema sp. CT11]
MNNNRAMLVLFLTLLFDLVSFGTVIPLVPLYAEHFGANPSQATMAVAVYSLMQLFFAPVWGSLSDRYGRRPVFLLVLLGTVIAYIFLGIANSFWLLFAARSFAGAMAGNIAIAQAYIADITTPTNRSGGMGRIGAAFGLGFIIGPMIGGILAGAQLQSLNFQLPSFFAAGSSLFALFIALTFLPETLNSKNKANTRTQGQHQHLVNLLKVLQRPQVGLLVFLYFLISFALSGIDATLALWGKREFSWGLQQIGYLFALMGLLNTCVQGGFIGFLSKRFGDIKVLILGMSTVGMGFLVIAFSKSLPLALIATILLGSGTGLSLPTIHSLISRFTTAQQQGKTMGSAEAAAALARILGPTWAGICFMMFGSSSPFLSGTLMILIAIAFTLRMNHNAVVPNTEIDSKPES